ncbi:MAG: glycosyltransferase family 87 protein [Bryobacteraceae bacterium]
MASSKAAAICCFALLAIAALAIPYARDGRSDFLSFYAGARLAGTADLYSVSRVYEIQQKYGTPGEVIAFTRLPHQAALLWPLGLLPYEIAQYAWQALNLLALLGFVWLWAERAVFLPLCCFYFPVWISFYSSQDVPLVLLGVGMAAFLLRRNRHFAGGLVLALCAIKFHLFLLLPLLVAGKRLWRFGGGFLAGALTEVAISFWAGGGWDWPLRYAALLRMNEAAEGSVGRMINLNGLLHGIPHSGVWLALASAAVAWGTWRVIRRSPMEVAVGAMLCGGVLVGMHAYMVDACFLLPLFISLADGLGLEKVFLLSGAAGLAAAAAGGASTAFIAQLALAALFVWLVLVAPTDERRPETAFGTG